MEKYLSITKAMYNQANSAGNYVAGFSKYLNDFMAPYLLATNYFSNAEMWKIPKTPPLEGLQSYSGLMQFNSELGGRALISSMKAMNDYGNMELKKGIDALFNTLFERNRDGRSDEAIIAFTERQALMTEMLVRGYPQAIKDIASEYGFGFERGDREKEWVKKALVEANAFREGVIERVAEGLCVFHEIDRYPYIRFDIWNERMTEITGYRMDEVNRLRWHRLGHPNPDIQDKAMAIVARLRAGDHLRGEEWEITAKNGVKRTVAVSTNTLALSSDQVHVLAVIYDLTRQKQAENERLGLERRVQHVQKIESLGTMAGGIAHDFNNILMVILGNIELALAEAPEASSLRPYLQEMEKSVFMAADLTRKILAYTGKTQFVITTADLNTLVNKTSGSLAELLPAAIELQTRLAPKLPAVKGDAAKICQLIANLITNAAEAYEPDKGGRITVSTGTLDCNADYLAQTVKDVTGYENPPAEGMYVFLEVADSAGGMDEKAARRVFDPFFTTKFQGRGLGMSTVLGIVRGLSGVIRLDSAVGKGTTIRVLFPAVTEDTPVCGQDADTLSAEAKHGDRTILLVGDELKKVLK
jgi:PAS domain S-box-containing protein